ncbi:MAG: AMP nucleosidase [Alphaproteobacteria bacterium]|nr:AMP nucleosidase [Alphaproteobacteria bacterium]MDP6567987.1 AMP nucleosidase [Alphaproteobacteria bacterium]MDP6815602.1 AMP nucleosidase [Alphaproteobacteria bacterium]
MSDSNDDRITVLAKEFTPAAMEYHRRAMGKRGYSLAGPIVARKFLMLEGPGEPEELFGGELYYAATFVRRDEDDN